MATNPLYDPDNPMQWSDPALMREQRRADQAKRGKPAEPEKAEKSNVVEMKRKK